MNAPKPKRRWYQYRLRTLLVLVLLVSIGMSWFAVKLNQARRQRAAVESLQGVGTVRYGDWRAFEPNANPFQPAWLRSLLGDDFFDDVTAVNFSAGSAVTDADLQCLDALRDVEAVVIKGTGITDSGLEHLQRLSCLQSLGLGNTPIGDSGLRYLRGLTQLETLNLEGTQVSDAGLEHLQGLSRLRKLRLGNTRVTNEGIQKFQQACPGCTIDLSNSEPED